MHPPCHFNAPTISLKRVNKLHTNRAEFATFILAENLRSIHKINPASRGKASSKDQRIRIAHSWQNSCAAPGKYRIPTSGPLRGSATGRPRGRGNPLLQLSHNTRRERASGSRIRESEGRRKDESEENFGRYVVRVPRLVSFSSSKLVPSLLLPVRPLHP